MLWYRNLWFSEKLKNVSNSEKREKNNIVLAFYSSVSKPWQKYENFSEQQNRKKRTISFLSLFSLLSFKYMLEELILILIMYTFTHKLTAHMWLVYIQRWLDLTDTTYTNICTFTHTLCVFVYTQWRLNLTDAAEVFISSPFIQLFA